MKDPNTDPVDGVRIALASYVKSAGGSLKVKVEVTGLFPPGALNVKEFAATAQREIESLFPDDEWRPMTREEILAYEEAAAG